jgi:glycosyltransferase involved in cell wall biosynthesis
VNVLFLTTSYPGPRSPVAGIFVREHAHAAALHANVAVVHLDRSAGFGSVRVPGEDFPTWRVRYPYSPQPVSMAAHLAAAYVSWRRVRASGFEPDLIHAHFFLAGAPAVLLARRRALPVVVTEQWSIFTRPDQSELTPALRRIASFAYGGADLVLPVSRALQAGIEAHGLHPPMRIVPNVVDTGLFHPAGARNGRLLSVGMMVEAKGQEYLLEAIALLAAQGRDVQLDLVGDGPLRPQLEAIVAARGLGERVRFLGLLPKPEVAQRMAEAGLFVLTSRYDNNPCVVIEAMASGLPVVATAVGGIPELVDERSGRLAPPQDPAGIAAEIAAALDGLAQYDRDAIAVEARRRFGQAEIGAELAGIYAEVGARR